MDDIIGWDNDWVIFVTLQLLSWREHWLNHDVFWVPRMSCNKNNHKLFFRLFLKNWVDRNHSSVEVLYVWNVYAIAKQRCSFYWYYSPNVLSSIKYQKKLRKWGVKWKWRLKTTKESGHNEKLEQNIIITVFEFLMDQANYLSKGWIIPILGISICLETLGADLPFSLVYLASK